MSPQKPSGRIVLVISSLKAGGAERVMSLLATEWARRGKPVTLVTLGGDDDDYPVPPEVERVKLNVMQASAGPLDALRNNWNRLTALRSAICRRKPLMVISFMDVTNILTLLAMSGTTVPVIVSERVDPRYNPLSRGWGFLRRHLYKKAFAVVVQTRQVAVWAEEFLPREKVFIVPNPVVVPNDYKVNNPDGMANFSTDVLPVWYFRGRWVIAMGRLYPQKGFDLLLQAFANIAEDLPDVNLAILGEGPERPALHNLIDYLDIRGRVVLSGRIQNAWPLLAQAECFVMSSRYEGFPNALLEAMAIGAPVVSFDCPSGPSDIIRNEVDGLLVPNGDVEALQTAVMRMLTDEKLRRRLGSAAKESMERYSIKAVTDQWERVIQLNRDVAHHDWPTV